MYRVMSLSDKETAKYWQDFDLADYLEKVTYILNQIFISLPILMTAPSINEKIDTVLGPINANQTNFQG